MKANCILDCISKNMARSFSTAEPLKSNFGHPSTKRNINIQECVLQKATKVEQEHMAYEKKLGELCSISNRKG